MEFDIYSEIVKRWNALVISSPDQSFTLSEYLSYLMNVYAALDRLEESTPGEELALTRRTWPLPPRAGARLEELRICRGDLPWLDYLVRARTVIDCFYPQIPPQSILVPMASDVRKADADR
jgi:hypothetical protein